MGNTNMPPKVTEYPTTTFGDVPKYSRCAPKLPKKTANKNAFSRLCLTDCSNISVSGVEYTGV